MMTQRGIKTQIYELIKQENPSGLYQELKNIGLDENKVAEYLVEVTKIYYKLGKYWLCIDSVRFAFDTLNSLYGTVNQYTATVYKYLGLAMFSLDQYDESDSYMMRALDTLKTLQGTPSKQILSLILETDKNNMMFRNKYSEESVTNAYSIYQWLFNDQDNIYKKKILLNFGILNMITNNIPQAINYLQQALNTISLKPQNIIGAEIYLIMGICYSRINNPDAVHYLYQSVGVLRTEVPENHPKIASFLYLIALELKRREFWAESLKCFVESMRIYERTFCAETRRMYEIITCIGDLHNSLGDNESAVGFYRRAIQQYESKDIIDKESLNYLRTKMEEIVKEIDQAYIEEARYSLKSTLRLIEGNDYHRAIDQLTYCLNAHQRATYQDDSLNSEIYYYIGNCYMNIGQFQQALSFFMVSEQYPSSTKDMSSKASLYHDLAICYKHQGNSKESLSYFCKSAIAQEKKKDLLLANTYFEIAGILYNQYQFDKALVMYVECLSIKEAFYPTDHHEIQAINELILSIKNNLLE